MAIKKTLIISNGYYTSINAISIIKQLKINKKHIDLFAYFKQICYVKEQLELTQKAFNINKIFYYLNYLHKNKSFNSEKFMEDSNSSYSYVLIPINSSTKKWVKIIKKMYPDIEIIFFSEGLLSYIKPTLDISLRKIIDKNKVFFNKYDEEVSNIIKNNFTNPYFINNDIVKSSLSDLKKHIYVDLFGYNLESSKNVLFLPQYYHLNNLSKNHKKLKNYKNIVLNLINKGYTVLVKDHPKTDNKVYDYLYKSIQDNSKLINLTCIQGYPIELFIDELNVDLIFSVYSTGMLNACSLFDIPSFSSKVMLQERLKSLSLYPFASCYLIDMLFPKIEDFLDYYKNDAKLYFNNYKKRRTKVRFSYITVLSKFLFKL